MQLSTLTRFAPILALAMTAAAQAQTAPVTLTTDIAVVRTTTDAAGKAVETYAKPDVVTPGDRLRFTVQFRNTGTAPATRFVITNPLPPQVTLETLTDGADATVSVDGGKTFKTLATLRVTDAAGMARPATLSDVTHLRWTVATVPPGTAGARRFFARVK